jgi:uncharacterized metal-binding protein YceD (DUF177 family)
MTRPVEHAWSVPVAVAHVPETGRRFEVVADERARAAVANVAGLAALSRLAAAFDVTRYKRDGLRVVGQVSATVGQICVVTLDPVENEIEEAIDLVFLPDAVPSQIEDHDGAGIEVPVDDTPEPLVGGTVDLGAVAVEFLMLAIDPYPRKPDAVFEPPASDAAPESPFAALAALQKQRNHGDR